MVKKILLLGFLGAVLGLMLYFGVPALVGSFHGSNRGEQVAELSSDEIEYLPVTEEEANKLNSSEPSSEEASSGEESSEETSEDVTSEESSEEVSEEDSEASSGSGVSVVSEEQFTFTASGDNLIHSYIYEQALERGRNGHYAFSYAYQDVADFFKNNDLNWIDQETICTDTLEPSSYPSFSTPGDCARALYKDNFKIFNISNNHTYDKGTTGINDTLDFWNNKMPEDVLATGLYKNKKELNVPVYDYNGIKIAFLSFTYGTNGISTPADSDYRVITIDEERLIRRQIRNARGKADVVMVSAHWGTEDSHEVTEDQKKLARKLTSWGADLIIGTHPHVVQTCEWIEAKNGRKAFCMYSLGNFISGQTTPDNLVGVTFRAYFLVRKYSNGKQRVLIRRIRFYPTVTYYGANHADEKVIWLRDMTEEMESSHGAKSYDSRFSFDYLVDVLKNNIPAKYLVLPRRTNRAA